MNINRFIFKAILVALGLSSCSVYYTTSQVDHSLKNSINQAFNSIGGLESQIVNFQTKYKEIQCNQKTPEMQNADRMFQDVNADLSNINNQKADLNQEYTQFQSYTQGKDKIISGTPEYEKLKATRNNIKSKMETLQSSCNQLVSKTSAANDYISKNVVPKIQMVNVNDYKIKFEKSIVDLNHKIDVFHQQLTEFQLGAQKFASENPNKNVELPKLIDQEMNQLNALSMQLDKTKGDLQLAYNDFITKTQGRNFIASCSNEWQMMQDTEKSLVKCQDNLNTISNNVQASANKIQNAVKK